MNNHHITQIIKEAAALMGQAYDGAALENIDLGMRSYKDLEEIEEFKRDLTEAGNQVRVIFLENSLSSEPFDEFLKGSDIPVLVFDRSGSSLEPLLLTKGKRGKQVILRVGENGVSENPSDRLKDRNLLLNEDGQVVFLSAFSYKSLVSDDPDSGEAGTPLSPVKRLFRLLSEERKEIVYIMIYAIAIGFVSLTLPLGIQATVELVSGGVVVSSVYVLIALVILGILGAGGLQVMQVTLVEYLQRRVFTKAALEFAFRVPRIKVEAIFHQYAPELINRFFDVLTIQKGLPKLLIDLTSAVIQILFGLLLLSFYHPFFVFFGLILIATLYAIFYITGPKGLQSSVKESKFKYKVVYWLEELGRALNSFKLSGNTSLPIKKTEYNVNHYLKNRHAHFKVLVGQYLYVIIFKAIVTGGLLIIGTMLVIQREITLGQFVASEVIIILILSSVEKVILYMEVVYDLLTAVDKIAHVTDLPLEKSGGIDMPGPLLNKCFSIQVKDLSYKYPGNGKYALKDINLEIQGGEKVCISGGADAGKTTLTNIISGLQQDYEGIVTVNNFSLRDLDLVNLRDKIGKNISEDDIFEGTLLENILVGKPFARPQDAVEAIGKVGLADAINELPDGLSTKIVSGGKGFAHSFVSKLILARCLVKKPKLLILNDYFQNLVKSDRISLINLLMKEEKDCSMVSVSNDPLVMSACDRVILMKKGRIVAEGPFEELLKANMVNDLVH